MMNLEETWDKIIELGIATEAELQLVTTLDGYSIDTLNNVVYVRTAYNNLNDYLESLN